ncbi:SDR family NAD(P)-dependent oxidoreductase [Oceanicella sp. SM1341]|uniref:SDR family NAD(P)-dependent oxidoreductase n=1 Tax=Oceanicella sp. SM1341 TaxID=1548889 RepID=UPI0018E4F0BA|nr:SDR family oxidoreductase [Oceanicella sp. SM1341]
MIELAPRHIRVNVLAPGATSTPGWHGLAPDEKTHQAMLDSVARTTPWGELGDPADVAAAALFLASDDARFVNGSELFADGGSAQI